ncbi:SIR2 family NAD-dependent protein deacylase [Lactobacillus agrestimuris]|uniref:SIR2 family NAD-dependent protein deacylase n=1 Tax=Lactobacillus agrestimuris TaxID=2941328 RepID=UPI0020446DE5|nr:Sir2 family NAD-dependent protein deacetylase [Lactobacillus agrestimuris]
MLFKHPNFTKDEIQEFTNLIRNSNHIYAITGAGISTNAGIPDLQHLSGHTSSSLSSEGSLESNPDKFYQGFHQIFIDPIFGNGPTFSHRALAQLEKQGKLSGVITTNVDYLHELAGSKNVADIWYSLNTNYCINCGRIYDIKILKQALPTCPSCGGLISPGPVYHHIGIDNLAYQKANHWMDEADLVITLGSNGYYSNINSQATVVNINKKRNDFDQRADLNLRGDTDEIMKELMTELEN